MANGKRPLTAKEKKQLEKQRKQAAKLAKKYHKLHKKQNAKNPALNQKSSPVSKDRNNQRASVSKDFKKRNRRAVSLEEEYRSTQSAPSPNSGSKIIDTFNARPKTGNANISSEQKFLNESEEIIKNLEPKESDNGGYYVDEYSARKKQERRAKQIRKQETEYISRPKAPVSPKQIKRRRILAYSGIFLIVLIIGAVLSLTVLFKTEKIEVKGDKFYYEDQIIAFSNVKLQQNIFIAAMQGTPDNIINNLPYVEEASISFSVPDTVIINIKNASPSYVIKSGNEFLIISAKGRIIEKTSENPSDLPELTCEKLKSTEVGSFVSFSDNNIPDILEDVSKCLSDNEVKNIKGFDVTDTANITLNYDGRILINLGLPEDLDYKIRTAITIINEKLDPNNTGTISGTLDVSNCNSTKVSHFKPADTQSTTPTVPSDSGAQSNDATAPTQKSTVTWDSINSTQPATEPETTVSVDSGAQDYNNYDDYANNYAQDTYDNYYQDGLNNGYANE